MMETSTESSRGHDVNPAVVGKMNKILQSMRGELKLHQFLRLMQALTFTI